MFFIQAYDAQFYRPYTGIVYTPPKFSDHIGVSTVLVLPPALKSRLLTAAVAAQGQRRDKATRDAQPHKSTPSVASFFTTAPVGEMSFRPDLCDHSEPKKNTKKTVAALPCILRVTFTFQPLTSCKPAPLRG